MRNIEGALNGLLSAPPVLWASVAGALAALLVMLVVIAWQRAHSRSLLPVAVLVFGALVVLAVFDRLSVAEHAARRAALLTRNAELTRSALLPGSAVVCLDAGAGDAVENACEKQVFASAQSTAAAVAYMGARLNLLADAAADDSDPTVAAALASTRRAVALDRYGIVAHVLATRYGCTADKCAAFALVDDAGALKAGLRAQVFDRYVSRYAAGWNNPALPTEKPPPTVSAIPAPSPVTAAQSPAAGAAPTAAVKPGEPWDFPSAASIPPVSIMNSEPPLPKDAKAAAQTPREKPQLKGSAATAQAGAKARTVKPANGPGPPMPLVPLPLVPPQPPQPQAASPPAR
jgi:hypothetical protein